MKFIFKVPSSNVILTVSRPKALCVVQERENSQAREGSAEYTTTLDFSLKLEYLK